jgi:hypothetical protein
MMFRLGFLGIVGIALATTQRPQVTTVTPVDSDISKPPPAQDPDYSFLHMTDLHISASRPYSLENLRAFCDQLLPDLSKNVLFLALTGDFTDGMGAFLSLDEFGQQEADWKAYRAALDGCVKTGIPILKIRGNHDAFGVESFIHQSNSWFVSIQDELNRLISLSSRGLILASVHTESGSFALTHRSCRFIFLDAGRIVPSPHQYHGEFSENQAVWLSNFITGASNTQARQTYVFIHFPLGSLTPSSRDRFLNAVSNSMSPVTYLSGHIHSVVGKRGVQSLRSHRPNVNELQLSDFKWSGAVRKVDINSGLFVDIPTHLGVADDSATLLLDPRSSTPLSLIGIHERNGSFIDTAKACNGHSQLRPFETKSDMRFYSMTDDVHCVEYTTVNETTGQRTVHSVTPIDTRLWEGTLSRFIFTYFFEFLHVVLLVEYAILVLVARTYFERSRDLVLTLFLVLAPILPTTLSSNFFSRPWVISNGVAALDVETWEVFEDFETIRIGIMMLMYILFVTASSAKKTRGWFGTTLWTVLLTVLSLGDVRMMIARGGLRTLILSPHSWFVVYMWYLWQTSSNKQL